MESLKLRPARLDELDLLWGIIQQAIERRKQDGSLQWQDGYPNRETILTDIENGYGFVLEYKHEPAVYSALIFNDEPTYEQIDGKWLSEGDFLVIHRIAVDEKHRGRGLIQRLFELLEDFAKSNRVFSIKVDTNYDNPAMLRILEKVGFSYCGEIKVRDGKRLAFEKRL